MNCGLSIAERDVLQRSLGTLPDTPPPRIVWERIQEQARAEGLLSTNKRRESAKWIVGAGLAAAVALMVLRLPLTEVPVDDGQAFPTEPRYSDVAEQSRAQTLTSLMVRSRELERNLRALPQRPSVLRAGTVATISELEDRIAEIDYWLNHPDVQLGPQQAEIYWRERVRLMNSLLQLRSAQARRVSF
jgi:hypothetical protein